MSMGHKKTAQSKKKPKIVKLTLEQQIKPHKSLLNDSRLVDLARSYPIHAIFFHFFTPLNLINSNADKQFSMKISIN